MRNVRGDECLEMTLNLLQTKLLPGILGETRVLEGVFLVEGRAFLPVGSVASLEHRPGRGGIKLAVVLLPDSLVGLVNSEELIPHIGGGVLRVTLDNNLINIEYRIFDV